MKDLLIKLRDGIWNYCKYHEIDSRHREAILSLIQDITDTTEVKPITVEPSEEPLKLYIVTGDRHMVPAYSQSVKKTFYVLARTSNEAHKKTLHADPFKCDSNWFISSVRALEFPGYELVINEIGLTEVIESID